MGIFTEFGWMCHYDTALKKIGLIEHSILYDSLAKSITFWHLPRGHALKVHTTESCVFNARKRPG